MCDSFFEIKGLSKKYSRSAPSTSNSFALRNVNLQFTRGEIFGIMGTSGAGKSTLMRCLVGLEQPTHGDLLYKGNALSTMSPQEIRTFRKQIGLVFQHFNLFTSRTATDNIAYPLEIHGLSIDERTKRCDELLELVGLSHKKEAYPSQLSGGEKQRIGIARALANRPDILLCDEATSALDPKNTQSILELLLELNRSLNLTIILITHQPDVVKHLCSNVGILSNGELIETGPVNDVFSNPKHPQTRELLLRRSYD